jgi:hypothetical protein
VPILKQRALLSFAGAAVAVLAVGAPAATAALDSEQTKATNVPSARYIETRLFFGTERPDGGPDVTDRQFMAFIDRSVTPSFPSGLTIQDGVPLAAPLLPGLWSAMSSSALRAPPPPLPGRTSAKSAIQTRIPTVPEPVARDGTAPTVVQTSAGRTGLVTARRSRLD